MPALSLERHASSVADLDALAKILAPYQLASGITWAADQSGAFGSRPTGMEATCRMPCRTR